MKAKKAKSEFVPVILTLETQEEVDKLMAVFTLMPVTDLFQAPIHQCLEKYYNSKNMNRFYAELADDLGRK